MTAPALARYAQYSKKILKTGTKKQEPSAAEAAEGQGGQELQDPKMRGSVGLPGRRDAEVDAAVAVPVVADAETVSAEVADVDPVATRAQIRAPDVDPFEQALSVVEEVRDDRVDQDASRRHDLAVTQQRLLLSPRLRRGVLDRVLAHQVPLRLVGLLDRERVVRVPGVLLGVEQLRVLGADFLDGERGDQHEDVRVHRRPDVVGRERDRRDLLELDAEVLLALGAAEEVTSHQRPGVFLGETERGEPGDELLHRSVQLGLVALAELRDALRGELELGQDARRARPHLAVVRALLRGRE